jgi:hypothetical protein
VSRIVDSTVFTLMHDFLVLDGGTSAPHFLVLSFASAFISGFVTLWVSYFFFFLFHNAICSIFLSATSFFSFSLFVLASAF